MEFLFFFFSHSSPSPPKFVLIDVLEKVLGDWCGVDDEGGILSVDGVGSVLPPE